MRALMIGLGAALVAEFQWVLVLFGLFLIVTGVKMLFSDDEHAPIQENRMYQWLRGHLRLTPTCTASSSWCAARRTAWRVDGGRRHRCWR